jgi:hypothetical protein
VGVLASGLLKQQPSNKREKVFKGVLAKGRRQNQKSANGQLHTISGKGSSKKQQQENRSYLLAHA